jgi:hypothetical protein
MPEYFDSDPGSRPRSFGGWRVVASAWAVALLVVVLFGGVQALASRNGSAVPQPERLVGVMIPQHDPSCAGSGMAINCHAANDAFVQAQADAEARAAYGF